MHVEQAVELGEEHPKLEIPWPTTEPNHSYFDLCDDPRAIARIEPARRHPPLRAFLIAVNGENSAFATARCRVSEGGTSAAATQTFEFSSEIDLVFSEMAFNRVLSEFEALSRRLAELLASESGGNYLSARLSIRQSRFATEVPSGYCLSVLLSAHGATAGQAELRWGLALARMQQALLFLSRVLRQKSAREV